MSKTKTLQSIDLFDLDHVSGGNGDPLRDAYSAVGGIAGGITGAIGGGGAGATLGSSVGPAGTVGGGIAGAGIGGAAGYNKGKGIGTTIYDASSAVGKAVGDWWYGN